MVAFEGINSGASVISERNEGKIRMRKSFHLISLLGVLALLAGCASPTAAPAVPISTFPPVATAEVAATVTVPASTTGPTSVPPAVDTMQVATSEPVTLATQTPEPSGTQSLSENSYLDDRSTPTGLIASLFNAINRKEYLRAYSYWENAGTSANAPSFDQFEKGYQGTASVQVTIGVVGGDVGAGQIYYTVPVVLQVQTTFGEAQIFAGCYMLHLPRPDFQAVPPFQPLGIEQGIVRQEPNSPNTDDLLAHACEGPNIPQTNPLNPSPVTDPTSIAASNYLDDRSDPVLVLRSLFNAVNRKEYVRAYSYWENPPASQNLPPFSQFQQGYQDTASVEATFGTSTSGAAAGNIYYTVPTALHVQTTSGQTQTFIGCYILHLGQPAIQATPPFDPLAIQSASIKQVDNNANINDLLGTACQNVP